MAPSSLTPRRPTGPRNNWTYKQRVALHILWTEHPLPCAERVRLFNEIFQYELAACGFPNGLDLGKVSAQYAERKQTQKPAWKKNWERVCHGKSEEDFGLRASLQAQIADILNKGNIGHAPLGPEPVTPTTPRQLPCNGYATPRPSTHKRRVAKPTTVAIEEAPEDLFQVVSKRKSIFNDDDDEEYTPGKSKKRRLTSPVVVIPPSPVSIKKHKTAFAPTPQKGSPSKVTKYRSGGRPGATMLLVRMEGSKSIWLKPDEYAETQLPLVNVSEEAAHPNPPALLFRYWDDRSHGRNSESGFVSGRFASALVGPRVPPKCDVIEWNDIAQHLNNAGMDRTGIPSPFISTSNLLIWVLRMALKKADPSARISIIDTSQLDPQSMYHVPPFYEELKKKRPFTKGGFQYRGSHEHLIWYQVPASAMVGTFGLAGITSLAQSSKTLKKLLRLEQLATAKSSGADIIRTLKQANVRISSAVAGAIGEIVYFLGLNHASSVDMLSRAVFEIVQGWALKPEERSQEKAEYFAHVFIQKSDVPVGLDDHAKLKHAFLNGLQWSCGDLNVHLKGPAAFEQMKSRAAKRGLVDPITLVTNEIDAIKLHAVMYEKRQQRAQLLLSDTVANEGIQGEGEDEDEIEVLTPATPHNREPFDDILYE